MKKVGIKIVIILSLFLVLSCGARKAEKNRVKEQSNLEILDKSKIDKSETAEIKAETNIKKSEQIIVNNQDQTTTTKETIEPIDNTKPASYIDKNGQKQELNNTKKTTETTTKSNNTKTDVKSETEALQKKDSKIDKTDKSKNDIKANASTKKATEDIKVDREAWSVWNWLWVLIPIGLVVWLWRKYKDKIWFI